MPTKQRQTVLRVPAAQHATHPAACVSGLRRQEQAGDLWRRNSGTRLEYRRNPEDAQRPRAGREHAGDLHVRQRAKPG